MQLFYSSEIKTDMPFFVFSKEESKHIIKVLRKKNDEILFVTNGLGVLFKTKISLASDSRCTVTIIGFDYFKKQNYHLHLAVAPTKMNDRFEWFLEKATEIGVHEITPIICDNSERKVVKVERFDKIILAAMKQSNQYFLPKLNPQISVKEFIKEKRNGQKYIAHCANGTKTELKELVKPDGIITILIGPEGDFSPKEIALASENKYIGVTLGNTRLRTETAALVACHTVVLIV
jgi:16S rRNA (uracil1498-N3)-methyltransferase